MAGSEGSVGVEIRLADEAIVKVETEELGYNISILWLCDLLVMPTVLL